MQFRLLACLFFTLMSAFGAPISSSRSTTMTTVPSSAVGDEPITEVVTVTITMTPTTSDILPTSTPPPYPTAPTYPTSTTSSEVPQETAPPQELLNAQEAQGLNSSFRTITLTDACTTGTSACVEGAVAKCIRGRWVGSPCSGSAQCFAVPVDSLTDAGTELACMAEEAAASLIANAGATGGAFGDQS